MPVLSPEALTSSSPGEGPDCLTQTCAELAGVLRLTSIGRGANPVMHRLKELRRETHIRAERKEGPLLRREGDHSEDAYLPE